MIAYAWQEVSTLQLVTVAVLSNTLRKAIPDLVQQYLVQRGLHSMLVHVFVLMLEPSHVLLDAAAVENADATEIEVTYWPK